MRNAGDYKTLPTYHDSRKFQDKQHVNRRMKERYSDYYKDCMSDSDCKQGHICDVNHVCLTPATVQYGWVKERD
jgi:hypothetical protein